MFELKFQISLSKEVLVPGLNAELDMARLRYIDNELFLE